MPRGNDGDAAAAELADRFSIGQGNAEALIQANNAERSQALIAASMKKVDEEATAQALTDLDKYEGPNGEDAIDVAVRGDVEPVAIVAYKDENGRIKKIDAKVQKAGGEPTKKAKSKAKSKAKLESSSDEDN